MTSQVIVDPEHVERFARNLKDYNTYLKENTSRLLAQFRQLGDTWRDQEHKKFAEEFERTTRIIGLFLQAADEYSLFLVRKADRAREYLRQR